MPSFIIQLDNKAIGFIQYYCLSEHFPEGIQKGSSLFKRHHPNQIAGIDLFIATRENRGQGLGVVIINQFINEFLSHFRLVVVDPNHDNIHAIRCYEKTGFEQSNYSEDENYCIMLKNISTDLMDIKIACLKDHSEVIPRLAKIWHEVLGSIWISEASIEQIEQGFYDELKDNSLPLTLVALKGAQVIGAVSLHEHEEINPDLAPWLESLVVDKAYQNQGVGKLLVERIKQKAKG